MDPAAVDPAAPGLLDALATAAFAFALMAAISLVAAGLIRLVVASLARRSAPQPERVTPLPVPVLDDRAAVAAAIAAAVHVVLPRHRIVHIGEAPGQDWTREARATLHGSHRPHR